MSVDVKTEIVIDRPVASVAAFATDPANAPRWYANIKSVEWKTPPPPGVGSQVAFVARFLGRTLQYTYEFAEFVPEERLVMRTEQGPFPMETTYTWEPTPNGSTRMMLRNKGEPAGFSRLVGALHDARDAESEPQGPRKAEVAHPRDCIRRTAIDARAARRRCGHQRSRPIAATGVVTDICGGPAASGPNADMAACIASLWPWRCIDSWSVMSAKNQKVFSSPRWYE